MSLNLRYRTNVPLDSITLGILWGEAPSVSVRLRILSWGYVYPRLLPGAVANKLVVTLGSANNLSGAVARNGSYFILELSLYTYLFFLDFYLYPRNPCSSCPFHQLSALKSEFYEPPSPSDPICTSSYELRSGFIALVKENSCSGKASENPYLCEFEQVCSCLKILGMTHGTLK